MNVMVVVTLSDNQGDGSTSTDHQVGAIFYYPSSYGGTSQMIIMVEVTLSDD